MSSGKRGLVVGIVVGAVAAAIITTAVLSSRGTMDSGPSGAQPERRHSVPAPEPSTAQKLETRQAALPARRVDAAVEGLASADASVRLKSIRSLRRLKATGEASRIRTLLRDPSPAVRRAAVMTVGRFRDADAFEEVLRLAREDRDASVRAAALSVLIPVGGRKNERSAVLLAGNLTAQNTDVRLAAVSAMNLLDWSLIGEKEKTILKDLALNDGLCQEMGDERVYPVRDAARTLLLVHGVDIGGE